MSEKGAEGSTGKGGTGIDANSESEHLSGPGSTNVSGPPLDTDDDHH